jgi:hypothetical protein
VPRIRTPPATIYFLTLSGLGPTRALVTIQRNVRFAPRNSPALMQAFIR